MNKTNEFRIFLKLKSIQMIKIGIIWKKDFEKSQKTTKKQNGVIFKSIKSCAFGKGKKMKFFDWNWNQNKAILNSK